MKTARGRSVIACYSLDGRLIKTYKSAKEAAIAIRVFPRSIDKCIREGGLVHNKQWRRCDQDNVPFSIEAYPTAVKARSIRPIGVIDDNNFVIETYPSIRKASILNNTDAHTIRDVLNGKTSRANNKKYRYLNDEEIKRYGYQLGKEIDVSRNAIIQLSLDGKYIKTYKSISEACLAINKPNRNQEIRNCLNGKYSTAFGYVWKYKDKANVIRKKKPMIYQLDVNTKKVINKYQSSKDASLSTGVSKACINNAIRGKQKTAGGFIWKKG